MSIMVTFHCRVDAFLQFTFFYFRFLISRSYTFQVNLNTIGVCSRFIISMISIDRYGFNIGKIKLLTAIVMKQQSNLTGKSLEMCRSRILNTSNISRTKALSFSPEWAYTCDEFYRWRTILDIFRYPQCSWIEKSLLRDVCVSSKPYLFFHLLHVWFIHR